MEKRTKIVKERTDICNQRVASLLENVAYPFNKSYF